MNVIAIEGVVTVEMDQATYGNIYSREGIY